MTPEVLLMTAAVSPSPDVPFTALSADERRTQYVDTFGYWRVFTLARGMALLVVETTGASSEELGLADHEHLAHTPDPGLNRRGKGALEASALDLAMAQIAANWTPRATVHKVTGRLRIKNRSRILLTSPDNSLMIRRSLDRSVCDTRVFSTTPDTWNSHFTGMSTEVDDPRGRYLEHVIAQRTIVAEYDSGLTVSQFVQRPKIVGVSGSNGVAYGGFTLDGLAAAIAPIEKRLLPRLRSRPL